MTKIELKKSKAVLWTITLVVALALVALIFVKQKTKESVNETVSPLTEKSARFTADLPPVSVADDFVLGSEKADLKIVVYEDYASEFSATNADNLDRIRAEFGKSVAITVRPYAVREKADSLMAAMAVRCAGEQKEWEKMRTEVFKIVKANRLTEQSLLRAAQELKLNGEDFKSCLTNTEKQGIILQETAAAKSHSVYGAPTLFINDDIIVGARPYDDYTNSDGQEVEGLKTIVSQYLQ
ncbi:MAG: DsbA family protein [Patescibacteria group bacterium]|jgi:protein-disulfide isomerase